MREPFCFLFVVLLRERYYTKLLSRITPFSPHTICEMYSYHLPLNKEGS